MLIRGKVMRKLSFDQRIETKGTVRPSNPILLFVVTAVSLTCIFESMLMRMGF